MADKSLIRLYIDLSLDARLLYTSQSITDILGYLPRDVLGHSSWEFFHPDEIPFARAVHGRGVQLDKAAVLHYCQIKNKDGRWVGCECVFTIVHDVIIACTSVFRRGSSSQSKPSDNTFIPDPYDLIIEYREGYSSSSHSPVVLIVTARPTIPHAFLHFE